MFLTMIKCAISLLKTKSILLRRENMLNEMMIWWWMKRWYNKKKQEKKQRFIYVELSRSTSLHIQIRRKSYVFSSK
jgi:hypothetical protein